MEETTKEKGFMSVSVRRETKERLLKIGSTGDSFDNLLNRLIDDHLKAREAKQGGL